MPDEVKFEVSVSADISRFDGWSPEQLEAFFAGVAEVLKTQARYEVAPASAPAEGE